MYHIKKDKRSIQSSKWIYSALCAIMQKKNYADITVTEIVERAGVGRATFYRNFDTIDDVLRLQIDKAFEELETSLSKRMETEKTTGTTLSREMHRLFLAFWYQDSNIITQLVQAQQFDTLLHSFERFFTSIVAKAGYLRYIDEKLRPYALAAACGASFGMLLQWIHNDKDISPDEMAELMDKSMRRMAEQAPDANLGKCFPAWRAQAF